MPGTYCAVVECKNNYLFTKITNPEIVYHKFRKGNDFVTVTIRKEWIRRCKRGDAWNPNTSRICSAHFTENDYERDMRNELLGLPSRKLLKKSAVPTLNLPNKPKHVAISAREERHLKKKKSEKEAQVREEINKFICEETGTSSSQIDKSVPTEPRDIQSEGELPEKSQLPENEVCVKCDKLLISNLKLQKELKIAKRKLYLQQKQLQYYRMRNKPSKKTSSGGPLFG